MRRPPAMWSVAVLLATASSTVAAAETESPLGPRVAATANGQTIAAVDEPRRAIVAFDAARPSARRDIVGPAAADAAAFVAVGYLTGDVVAAVCRAGDDWSLRTYRTAPDGAVDAGSPLQRIPIGTASGGSEPVDLAVSHARGWLAVTGLPSPLPPVLRAAVAGVRVGPLTERGCPSLDEGDVPVASAVSPADELVLVLREAAANAAPSSSSDTIAYFDLGGRELLRLSARLRSVRGLDFGRGDRALWTVAADDTGREGLWRLDAVLADGRQTIRPTLVATVESPHDLVSSSPRAIVVVHGGPAGRMTVIDPTGLAAKQEGEVDR